MWRRRSVILLVLICTVPFSALSIGIEGIDFRWGHVYIFNEYQGQGSEGVPLNTYGGVGLPVAFQPIPVSIGLTVDLFYREYLATTEGPVVPTQIETGAAAGLGVGGALNLIMGLPIGLDLRFVEQLSIGLGVSPTFVLRIPVRSIEGDIANFRPYFFDRVFFPEAYLSVVYDYSANWSFGFSARWMIPAFNWWLETTLPFQDQMMIGATLIIRRRFN